MPRFVAFASLVPVLALSLVACSAHHDGGGTPSPAPTGSTGPVNTDPAFVVQKGVIIDFDSGKPFGGATITAGDQSTTADDKGHYALKVHKGEAFQMVVTAPNYVKLVEQATVLDADYDRGTTNMVPIGLGNLLHGTLQGYDAALGVLSVAVLPTGSCTSEGGTKISVSPEGSAKVKYMQNKFPSNTVDSVQPGEFPSAVIYNLQPGVPVTVKLESEGCKQAPFPFTHDGITYEAMVSTEPGDVTSFQRLFLQ
jgi:hypothetical protein